MRAIVLAAGVSERMGGDVNKCIMPLNDKGDTMLGRVLGQLKALSVWPTVVVGYQAEEIMCRYCNEASFVYNPEYETTSSLYSAWLAWTLMEPSAIVMVASGSNIITDEALSRLYYTMTIPPGVVTTYSYPHGREGTRNSYLHIEFAPYNTEIVSSITEYDCKPPGGYYMACGQFAVMFRDAFDGIPQVKNWRTVGSAWYSKGCIIVEVSTKDTLDVNTPHDFEQAKEMIKLWSS